VSKQKTPATTNNAHRAEVSATKEISENRPLRIVAFNANDIWRERYELSKQLQDLHIDVALLSETHLKPHERFYILNYHFYWTDCFPGRKG
jgi:hypothetical protein